jgi:hypothetical protein
MKSYRIVDTMALQTAKTKPCAVCARFEAEPHHVKSKKSGGDDMGFNLMPLCRRCHKEVHDIGLTTFASKYKQVTDWLLGYGWELDTFMNKWRHAND